MKFIVLLACLYCAVIFANNNSLIQKLETTPLTLDSVHKIWGKSKKKHEQNIIDTREFSLSFSKKLKQIQLSVVNPIDFNTVDANKFEYQGEGPKIAEVSQSIFISIPKKGMTFEILKDGTIITIIKSKPWKGKKLISKDKAFKLATTTKVKGQ